VSQGLGGPLARHANSTRLRRRRALVIGRLQTRLIVGQQARRQQHNRGGADVTGRMDHAPSLKDGIPRMGDHFRPGCDRLSRGRPGMRDLRLAFDDGEAEVAGLDRDDVGPGMDVGGDGGAGGNGDPVEFEIVAGGIGRLPSAQIRHHDRLRGGRSLLRAHGATEREDEGEGRFNPIGYHVGTVWPFDNSFIAWGLRRYGFKDEAAKIAAGILDAAGFFDGRLPEAFGGYDRTQTKYPVQYPTACSPQAWSTGTPLLLLRTMLGLEPLGEHLVVDPALPVGIGHLELLDIPGRWGRIDAFGRGRVDVETKQRQRPQLGAAPREMPRPSRRAQ
jgi:hypothetical protein